MKPAWLLLFVLACDDPESVSPESAPPEERTHPFLRMHTPTLTCSPTRAYHREVRYCDSPSWCIEELCVDVDGVPDGPAVTRDRLGVLFAQGDYAHGERTGMWAIRESRHCGMTFEELRGKHGLSGLCLSPGVPDDHLTWTAYPRK